MTPSPPLYYVTTKKLLPSLKLECYGNIMYECIREVNKVEKNKKNYFHISIIIHWPGGYLFHGLCASYDSPKSNVTECCYWNRSIVSIIVLLYIRIPVTKYPVVLWLINHRCKFSCGVCNISVTLSADNIVQYSSHTNLLDVFTDCQSESC